MKASSGVLALFLWLSAPASAETQPKLVLQITVDGLRGDLPTRFESVLGEGGFQYLRQEGIWYNDAHYQHANTETIVGHTSLATGTVPAAHGMVGNVWFDHELGRLVYNIEDPDYHLLAAGADVDAKTEIDPTQRAAKVEGRSPANILSSTFSDELAIHFAGQSKIFAVSVKDRGAVPLAGHAGKAFWFSKASGDFVTSSFYYDKNPDWVDTWNAGRPAAAYSDQSWGLLYPQDRYMFGDHDDVPYETDFPGYGRTFPHAFGAADDKYFTTKLTLSPVGDALTLEFAKTLVLNEKMGQGDVPDYLSISFSSTDYVGHLFGASSLEMEDNIAHLDRTLADLFSFIDQQVGLDQTLIVLSADHGQPEVPGYMHEMGVKHAGYFDPDALDKAPAIEALKKKFGLGAELIEAFFQPYVYLNHDLIDAQGLDRREVEDAVVQELLKYPGIAFAVSSSALMTGDVPNTVMTRAVLKNYQAKRSGDIYIVFSPNVFINDFDGLVVASTHGSPWRYDTFVPVVFAGAGLQGDAISRRVSPYDIAPTLAGFLGVKPPSGSVGDQLPEVLAR
ncbi:MAG: alkaline phosphatase family protein [Candidatus Krumholzibacteria bacterium]|nr:alkaline phosphatase family protein [Candidatus Krumholzibacteria bacterium]